MRKILVGLVITTMAFAFVGCNDDKASKQIVDETVSVETPESEDKDESDVKDLGNTDVEEKASYVIGEGRFENAIKNNIVFYPTMNDFRGELLQDYMNQSLIKIVEIYGTSDYYSDVDIKFEITNMDDKILSVVYKGTAHLQGGKQINIMHSMNLDVAYSSNEINYGNLVKDDYAIRALLTEKAKEMNIIFEAEGIRVYFKDDEIVFYYMPLDDSAIEFVEIPLKIEVIKEMINSDFGEKPAS